MFYLKTLAIAIIAFPLLTGCGKTATISTLPELTGSWKLEKVVQENGKIYAPEKNSGDINLLLKEKGELEITTAHNYLTGFYETAQQNSIQMDGDGTDRQDSAWGNLFVNALPKVNLYDLKPNKLTLYYDDNSQLVFSRMNTGDQRLTASR